MYKRSRLGEWEALFLMKSFNQAIVWLKYNRRIIDNDQRNLKQLLETKTAIQNENVALEKELKNKNLLIQDKTTESDRLEIQKRSRTHLLSQVRKDQQSLQEQIRLKKLAYQTIRGEISRREKDKKTTSRVDTGGTPFASLKGKMAWPVRGNIVTKYGTQKAAATKTEIPNYGIEIKTTDRASVLAVSAGRVALVVWQRGMGNIVMLGHGGGYYTVYAHLEVVLVYSGQEVSPQEIIGYVGDRNGLYGSNLHFQIWNKEIVHNPETWLRK